MIKVDFTSGDIIANNNKVGNILTHRKNGYLFLSEIKILPEYRGLGYGQQAMEQIIDYANKNNYILALTPSSDFGGNKNRLINWYKSLGFVMNKGKNKDFQTMEMMYKLPETMKIEEMIRREIWTLNENETSFNVKEFENLPSFAARRRYAEQHLKRIATGSARAVYELDPTKVLKLAINPKGIAQNDVEIQMGMNDYYAKDSVTEVYEADEENHTWLIAERGKKLTPTRFYQLTGVKINDLADWLNHMYQSNRGNRMIANVSPELDAELWENEFSARIIDLMNNYDLPAGDLGRISSYGEVVRDGQPEVLLTDYSLTKDVYQQHYERKPRGLYAHEDKLVDEADTNYEDELTNFVDTDNMRDGGFAGWALLPNSVSQGGLQGDDISETSVGDKNQATLNGKKFWIGSVSTLDGYIEEIHTYEEAESHDFHHSFYFSPQQVEKIDNGENVVFWIQNSKIFTWEGLHPNLESVIKQQIQITEGLTEENLNEDIKPYDNLALAIDNDMYYLYDPKITEVIDDMDWEQMGDYILGAMALKYNEDFDGMEIVSIAAKKGYGPLLYLIGMSSAGEKGLMPSRHRNEVTPEAKNVWKEFFEGQGKPYIKSAIDLSDNAHPEPHLNKKYITSQPIDTYKMYQNHQNVVADDPYGEKESTIIEIGDAFLTNQMRSIYHEGLIGKNNIDLPKGKIFTQIAEWDDYTKISDAELKRAAAYIDGLSEIGKPLLNDISRLFRNYSINAQNIERLIDNAGVGEDFINKLVAVQDLLKNFGLIKEDLVYWGVDGNATDDEYKLGAESINEDVDMNKIGYHVTRRLNLPSIKRNGLLPQVPEDYGDSGDIEGVYLFKSLDDAQNALYNWLGERIEDWEEENDEDYDEVILKVDLSGLNLIDSVEYEWISTDIIEPNRIIDVLEDREETWANEDGSSLYRTQHGTVNADDNKSLEEDKTIVSSEDAEKLEEIFKGYVGILSPHQIKDNKRNNKASKELKKILEKFKFNYVVGIGEWDDDTDTHEQSYIVSKHPELIEKEFFEILKKLAKKFEQEAFIFGKEGDYKLYFLDGKVENIGSGIEFEDETFKAFDFVSEGIVDENIGYKVMRTDGQNIISGADARQTFPLKKGNTISMVGDGIYLSPNKDYVIDYYSGLADNEVLLTLEYDPETITTGNLEDKEPEISVPNARIVDYEILNENQIINEAGAGINRLMNHMKENDFAIMSANRNENTMEQNKQANQKLSSELQSKRAGFVNLIGHWEEIQTGQQGETVDVKEQSFFIPKPEGMDTDEFKEWIVGLGDEFEQDAVLIGTPEEGAALYYMGGRVEKKGRPNLLNINKAYSQLRRKPDATFVFESRQILSRNDYKRIDDFEIINHRDLMDNIQKKIVKKEYFSDEDYDDIIYLYLAMGNNLNRYSKLWGNSATDIAISTLGKLMKKRGYLKEERIKSWMPGMKTVSVKKKCRLGGKGDGTSAACDQGDIKNLELKPLKDGQSHKPNKANVAEEDKWFDNKLMEQIELIHIENDNAGVYIMSLKDDEFIHFTKKEYLDDIIRTKTIKSGAETGHGWSMPSIYAVSLTYGEPYADVQQSDKANRVAIKFKTSQAPDVGFAVEVIWKNDKILMDEFEVIDVDTAKKLLSNTPHKLDHDNDHVLYYEGLNQPQNILFGDQTKRDYLLGKGVPAEYLKNEGLIKEMGNENIVFPERKANYYDKLLSMSRKKPKIIKDIVRQGRENGNISKKQDYYLKYWQRTGETPYSSGEMPIRGVDESIKNIVTKQVEESYNKFMNEEENPKRFVRIWQNNINQYKENLKKINMEIADKYRDGFYTKANEELAKLEAGEIEYEDVFYNPDSPLRNMIMLSGFDARDYRTSLENNPLKEK